MQKTDTGTGTNADYNLLCQYKNKYNNIDIKEAEHILEKYFGFAGFKEKQLECLKAIKQFEHVLNIMPTGEGKSLIFQVIPLIMNGISIVISPLLSLINDQIKSLRKRNITVETINSSFNKKQNEKVLNMLKDPECNIKVIYITPETAISETFLNILKQLYLNKKICLISIDEVHCISTWGCDFRRSYRNLNKLLEICPYVRIYSCTASATKRVERDIILNLKFENTINNNNNNGNNNNNSGNNNNNSGNNNNNNSGNNNNNNSGNNNNNSGNNNNNSGNNNNNSGNNNNNNSGNNNNNSGNNNNNNSGNNNNNNTIYTFTITTQNSNKENNNYGHNQVRIVRTSFNRPNLKYFIVYSDLLKIDKKKSILNIIKEKKNEAKAGIIFCFKRNTCDNVSKYLRQQGIQALSYHAGLSNNARKKIQDKWINSTSNILVATIAFGMGIDKQDVSFIIHFNIPKSIENYYQESGRAGRNGNIAFCYLFYSKEDVKKLAYIIKSSYPDTDIYDKNKTKMFEKEMANLESVHNMCINEKCIRSQILNYFGEIYNEKKNKKNHYYSPTDSNYNNKSDFNNGNSINSIQNEEYTNYENYCCSYCHDVKGSKEKIKEIINLYEEKNKKTFLQEQKSYTYSNICSNNNKRKNQELYDEDDDSYYEQTSKHVDDGQEEYKLNNKKIKGYASFQSASAIISQETRQKGIIEVMKELERREDLFNNETENPTTKINNQEINSLTSENINIKKKYVFSAYKHPRRLQN
ncbi:ATP-dependent DNA helicase Q1 [Hepatocystis sp. ex Piliocolobus tephrosceles]|nr:ATP-dependent DNA helicase Q1 [Hepatocystis sp. ex Piliocolobus tephrosceles]